MKRPQSAKPGYRGHLQHSYEDFREDEPHKNQHRNKVKLMKPDLTTNDFARIMPKKIYQDKERLYSEGLQLKQALNETVQENVRLKTRISILEKEKDKMNKYIETAAEASSKAQSRLNIYSGAAKNDKENLMVRNLKKMIRDSKEENEYLKQQNAKIKKAIKYTKINELEIERKMLIDQNQRINQILVELNGELADQQDYEHEVNELKGYLEEEVEANKELSDANQKYLQYIEELEEKLKKQTEKAHEKQKKLQRQLGLQKRKLNESVKLADDLRKELRILKEGNHDNFKKKQKNLARPASSHPYQSHSQNRGQTPIDLMKSKKEFQEIQNKNLLLEKELKQVKLKLQKSEAKLEEVKPQKKKAEGQNRPVTTEEALEIESQPKQGHESSEIHQPFVLKEETKVEQNVMAPEDEYEQEFEQNEKDQQLNVPEDEEAETEQIFIKQNRDGKGKKKGQSEKEKDKIKHKKKKEKEGKFKPEKKILQQMKQLLTYRMKAHRYPFEALKKDIQQSQETQFNCIDLEAMVKAEPFFLKPQYAQTFLQYAFEDEKPPLHGTITNEIFLTKMRKLIDQFELLEEKQEDQMLLRIAQMTTTYPEELEMSFEQAKNGPDTISKDKLTEMFKRLGLADHYIEAIIVELSLCSEDLQHLNFHGFFQRFYIQDPNEDPSQDPHAINEEQIQSSGEDNGRNIPKIVEEEYEDDKVNFIMDDEGQLSMGMKGANNYDQDIVSDDGHI